MPSEKYIFFGTPEFAHIVLKHLIDAGHFPAAVVCNPDRPVGRKKIITPPPVKQYIESLRADIKNDIVIFQPEKLSEIENDLRALNVELFVVAAYAKIISQKILDIPKYGTVGVHPSLLPKLRGASPIQSAILNMERETGVTLYFVDKDVDHGAIIEQKTLKGFDLNEIDFSTLHDVLANLGGAMIAENVARLMRGEIKGVEQNHNEVTFSKKFLSADGFIEYQDLQQAIRGNLDLAKKIHATVRALTPEPGAYTMHENKRMKILKTELTANNLKLKRIQTEGGLPRDVG